jgi:hypothetical protein
MKPPYLLVINIKQHPRMNIKMPFLCYTYRHLTSIDRKKHKVGRYSMQQYISLLIIFEHQQFEPTVTYGPFL